MKEGKFMFDHSINLQLARFVRAGMQNGVLYFGFGSVQQAIREKELQFLVTEVAKEWRVPQPIHSIRDKLVANGLIPHKIDKAISFLLHFGFVLPSSNFDEESRNSRDHLFYSMYEADPRVVEESLSQKSVAILGCGGIGNIVGVNLATMGVKKLILVDDDRIETSNLTRQILFSESDVGSRKVDILSRELRRRRSDLEVETHALKVTSRQDLEFLAKPDLIVVSADAGDILNLVNHYSQQYRIPYLNVGYVEDVAVFGPFVIPGETGCIFCQNITVDNKDHGVGSITRNLNLINRAYQAPSVGPVNMLAAAMATLDIVRYFGKFGVIQSKDRRVGLWTHDLHMEYQDCRLNPSCPKCQTTSLRELSCG